ncbi:MAG: F0F1 ATP synthase subunit beta, partial [Thermacetogeniaceae bacterium]
MEARNYGTVVQVIGPVVDIEFPPGQLPDLFDAIVIDSEDQDDEIKATVTQKVNVTLEAMQHLGNNTARWVAMSSTDGIRRGMRALDTKSPIKMPVGRGTLGRIFNVLGEPIDGKGAVDAEDYYPIHRPAPPVVDQRPAREILETGIKVIDLLAPFAKGGKIGLFGGAGVGKTVIIQELIRNIA